ncbi:MAG TPA: outer membrane beta-barrel domain-containing protein [Bdellovibrionales bacterium]|nr:outer membrane beta-barrel domain-containing protein [Bdellovibrionales bacterium]
MHRRLTILIVGIAIISGSPGRLLAQEAQGEPPPPASDDVENILEQTLQQEENKQVKEEPQLQDPKKPEPKLTDLSGLANLAPFSDVAVIQKKFLPKTGRFEFFPGLGMVMNDAFFMNVGLNMRLAYFFSEYIGVEAALHVIGTSEKQVTKDLADKKGVVTRTLVSPQGYYGGAARWTPVYGKMGFLDKTIIPYDLYFLGGLGMTQTNQGTSSFTVHAGTGQTFALKKWMAARWELSWYFYNAKTSTGQGGGNFTNLWATVGLSFFFPEAKYR